MRSTHLLALLVLSGLAAPAWAGEWHARAYPARVVSVARVTGYQIADPFADPWKYPMPIIKHPGEAVCRVRVRVKADYSAIDRKPHDLFGAPELCERVKKGAKVEVQYYGLADAFQFVSIRLGEDWYEMPRMRETKAENFARCMAGPSEGYVPGDECARLEHGRSL